MTLNHWRPASFAIVPATLILAAPLSAQSPAAPAPSVCSAMQGLQPLPNELRETSGLAAGRVNPGILWTHNDSGDRPELFAIGSDGVLKARMRVTQALFSDWEDIDAGACGGSHCLYVADIGDNAGVRSNIVIYEFVEPQLTATEVAATRAIRARYADGAQDAEAFFRAPTGEFYIVTKGRQKPIRLYRLIVADNLDEGILQPIRELAPRPTSEADRITGATISANGEWVAIRSYATLFIYRFTDLLQADGAPTVIFPLNDLKEKQGEAVALADDGTVWLTSEAEKKKDVPTLAKLSCALP